jgi:predicted CXXCH cytochrome family protein
LLLAAAVGSAACSATARHRVLTVLFDGVPPLRPNAPTVAASTGASATGSVSAASLNRPTVHGPYAAKLCSACHAPQAGNTLLAPREQLCLRCHQFSYGANEFVHGPLAAGGCVVCHDPHSSRNRYLLVSDSELFCFHCHDRERMRGHAGGEAKCTTCHDPHMSAKKFLLR